MGLNKQIIRKVGGQIIIRSDILLYITNLIANGDNYVAAYRITWPNTPKTDAQITAHHFNIMRTTEVEEAWLKMKTMNSASHILSKQMARYEELIEKLKDEDDTKNYLMVLKQYDDFLLKNNVKINQSAQETSNTTYTLPTTNLIDF